VLTLGAQQLPVTSNVPGSVPRILSTNPDAGANPVLTAHVDKIIERGSKRELRVAQADAVVDTTLAQIEDTLRTQRFQLRQAFVAALLARDNLELAAQLQPRTGGAAARSVRANRRADGIARQRRQYCPGRPLSDPGRQPAVSTDGARRPEFV
jgi:hypothetical protein